MADNQNLVNNLIGSGEFKDSRLASLLQTLANDLYGLHRQVNPPTAQSRGLGVSSSTTATTPTGFAATVFSNDIRLTWAPASSGFFLYEIKLGSDYDTADILLTTATHSADIDPVSRFIITDATYTFWLTSVDSSGNRSEPASVSVTIPAIGAPVITPTIIGNSVLLRWTAPSSSFTIDHYIVNRNGSAIGIISGTFDVIFEPTAGTYEYTVQAVDIVGNLSELSGVVSIALANPTDYILYATLLSTFTGTKIRTYKTNLGRLFAIINETETWANHFGDRNWSSIQDQIDAGYPLYFEPGP